MEKPDASHQPHNQHHEREHHRLSFSGLHFGRSSRESHTNPNLVLDWKIESPPIVLYGDAENSSGALVSGQLFLRIKEDGFRMESFKAKLRIHVTQKRPFTAHCADCINQYTEISKWDLLQAPLTLTKGPYFPLSSPRAPPCSILRAVQTTNTARLLRSSQANTHFPSLCSWAVISRRPSTAH